MLNWEVTGDPDVWKATEEDMWCIAAPSEDKTVLEALDLKLAIETRYDDKNMWLKWVKYTAETTAKLDCVACAKARPTLGTAPYRLSLKSDPERLFCTVKLFIQTNTPEPGTCNTLNYLYPKVKRANNPPSVAQCFMTGTFLKWSSVGAPPLCSPG
uniref:Uncharacterized protein n=1 Tax=Amphilophus citrinellus TaxID=61819 RepID=A0A3Q0RV27_AMPCI